MRRTLLLLLVGALAVSCTQQTRIIPATGVPTAELNDWLDEDADGSNRRVFAVLSVDGVEVPNAARNVQRVGFGAGAGTFPYLLARPIEAKEVTVRVIGRHLVNAPISEVFGRAKGTFQELQGTLTFRPKPGGVYRVAGVLSAHGSEIWIEESESKVRVSGSVKRRGDA